MVCSDEVKFNSPGFQGNKNYEFWRATYFSATFDYAADDGTLTIVAGNNSEETILTLSSAAVSSSPKLLTDASFSNIADFHGFRKY